MKKKILLIDEEAELLELTKHLLESRGYQVIALTDSYQALEFIKNNPPDLVLLDIIMIEERVSTLYEALRSESVSKDIPVIITSSYLRLDHLSIIPDQSEYNCCLTKPFKPEELINRIKQFFP